MRVQFTRFDKDTWGVGRVILRRNVEGRWQAEAPDRSVMFTGDTLEEILDLAAGAVEMMSPVEAT